MAQNIRDRPVIFISRVRLSGRSRAFAELERIAGKGDQGIDRGANGRLVMMIQSRR